MILEGKWKGYYAYGQGYPPPYFGERVAMEVILKGDDDDGFEGIASEEESPISIPDESKISGFMQEDMISFVKTYPNYYQLNEDREYGVQEGKEMELRNHGYYDEKYACFFGFWELEVEVFDNIMGPSQVIYGGTWKLERV